MASAYVVRAWTSGTARACVVPCQWALHWQPWKVLALHQTPTSVCLYSQCHPAGWCPLIPGTSVQMSMWLLPIRSTAINSCSNQEDGQQSEELKGEMWGPVGLILLLNNLTPSLAHPLASTRMEAHGELKPVSSFQDLFWKWFQREL